MVLAGVGNLSAAQYNIHWNGKVYFLAPETWNVDETYKYIQVDITRTTSATSSNHQEYIGNMTRLGTSRLFYVSVNANHNNWNQNEYIAFTANDHNYNSGSFRIDNNHYYTTPLDYGVKDGGYYLFKPNSKTELQTTTNANKITGIWASSRDDFKVDQTVQIYTNGSSSATGGTVKLTGYYLSSDNALSSSDVTSSSTSAKYSSVPGTEMKLTATAKTGYKFDGWYTAASGGTKLSSNATYTYNVYEATTVYVRFLSQEYTITYKDQDGANFSGTHASEYPTKHTYGKATTLDTPTKSGYEFLGWFTNSACTGNAVKTLGATAYTANITLYAQWKQSCITPEAPFEGVAQSKTICKGSPYTFDPNYKWYTGSTGETTVSGSKVINSNTDYYIVNVAPEGCESARTKYTINVDEPLVAPTLIYTNPTTCNGNPTAGSIVIENYANYSNEISFALYKDENPTGITYNDGFAISERGDYKVVMTTSASNVCGQSVETQSIEIEIIDYTPVVNSFRVNMQETVCAGNPVTMSYDGTSQSGAVSYAWYEVDSDVVIGTEATLTIQQAKNASYKLVVTVTSNNCPASDEATITVKPQAVPSAPTFDTDEMSVCVNEIFNLPAPNNVKQGEDVLWTIDGQPIVALGNSQSEARDYKYTAYINDGCPSAGKDFIVRVKALPEITSITQNVDSPVFYEDVTLTATATDGATVKWYEGDEEKGEGLTYVVTSASDASKIVTAKAFLNGCESAVASHTVNFSAENCNPTPSKDLIIICDPNGEDDNIYCYAWDASDNKPLGNWPGTKGTKEDGKWRWEIKNTSATYTIIFNNNNNCQTNNIEDKLTGGWQYDYKLASSGWCNANRSYTSKTSLSVPAPKSTPTVKTVLAESNPGEGNLSFKGQVVKTGCYDQAKLAVQYRLKDSGNDYTTYYWNNSEALVDIEPGKEFEINLTDITPDGVYEVRARIYISSDVKSYGNVIEVPITTVKTPISNINLSYCNESGTAIADPNPMCKGTTAYIKLDYEGSRYSECKWLINGVATQKITKVSEKVWSFEIQQEEELVTVELRNDANKDGETPTWATSNKLSFTMVPEPISPTISLSPSVICSNNEDGATLNLAALVAGQSYELYKYADENDNTGAKVAGYNAIQCTDASENLSFTGLKEAGRYFVKAYNTTQCQSIMAGSAFSTLEVVDASDVFINFVPTSATTTPWMPAKFTVNASDKYTLTVPDGVVYNIDGNKVSVKIPLPAGSTGGDGQYENVSFPEGAKTSYTITANLATSGGVDNPCAAPASATITLTPYVEPCTEGH